MKIKSVLSIFILALAGCGGGGDEPSRQSVTLDGDSILFGAALSVKPADVLRSAGFDVDDRAAVGLNLKDMVSGYDEPYPGAPASDFPLGPQPAYERVQRSTQFVVIEAGVNDSFILRSAELFEADMRHVIEVVLREGRFPVLTGIVQLGEHPFVNDAVQKLRAEYDAITIQLADEYGLRHARWGDDPLETMDGIHRTQEASNRLAQRLVSAMQ